MSQSLSIDSARAFDLLRRIGFVRMGGTPQERQAAEILAAELTDAGLAPTLEPFAVSDAVDCTATLEVLAPYRASYTVTAFKNSGSTPIEGVEADFFYAEEATEADLADAAGKVVLVGAPLRPTVYHRLKKAGVAGFLTVSGSMRQPRAENDLPTCFLRENLRRMGAPIPGACMLVHDAFDMVQRGACRVRLVSRNTPVSHDSHNLVATVPGTQPGEEFLVLGAHYDSVEFSTGVYDNGAGSVILMELARWFAAHPPRRTLRFVWFGSEERGLLGSRAYVKAHEEELKHCRMMLNVDVGAPVLGADYARLIAEDGARAFTDAFMKLRGYGVQVDASTYSSDSMPFADADIPAINFWRAGVGGAAFIHCRDDVLDYLSAPALEKTGRYMLDYADTLANGVVFPFARTVPQDLHEKIDEYFFKKEVEEAEKEFASEGADKAAEGANNAATGADGEKQPAATQPDGAPTP